MNPSESSSQHIELFRYLRQLVDTAERARSPSPKFALVEAYWHIGRIVVETEQDGQQRADYGIHLIEFLSQRLTEVFGKGYSLPNMWRFKQFFLAFPILPTHGRELTNLRQHLRTELCWSHYRLLMQLENLQERNFYLHQAADERWPVRLLQQLVRSRYYYQMALGEGHLLAGTTKIVTANGAATGTYPTLSAVGGTPRTRLANIKKILLERYVGYAYVAQRQFLSVAGQDRWAELVFFHYVLNRFILVQLGEHDPLNRAAFTQLVDAYVARQPPQLSTLPIGLLISEKGLIKYITSTSEKSLSIEQTSLLPLSIA